MENTRNKAFHLWFIIRSNIILNSNDYIKFDDKLED